MTYLPIISGASMGNMGINDRKALQKIKCETINVFRWLCRFNSEVQQWFVR